MVMTVMGYTVLYGLRRMKINTGQYWLILMWMKMI